MKVVVWMRLENGITQLQGFLEDCFFPVVVFIINP